MSPRRAVARGERMQLRGGSSVSAVTPADPSPRVPFAHQIHYSFTKQAQKSATNETAIEASRGR